MVVKDAWPEATGSFEEQTDMMSVTQDPEKTTTQKKIKISDVKMNPPVYKEEDITGLMVKGTNVYQGEKRHLMNVLDYLLQTD